MSKENMSRENNQSEDLPPREVKSRKGIGGPKPKEASEKATCKVGGFWLKPAEKARYDRLFASSKLENHTAFFRSIFFEGKLKLYYSDQNTGLIYDQLVVMQSRIDSIVDGYGQVVKSLDEVITDKQLYHLLNQLQTLIGELTATVGQVHELFLAYKPIKKTRVIGKEKPSENL